MPGKYALKDFKNGIESCRKNGADDARFERKTSTADDPCCVPEASNGQVIGKSQMYSSTAAMEKGIDSVKSNCSAALEDLTT